MSSIHFILNDIIIPYIETFEMSEELFYDRLKVIVNDIIEDLVCRKFKFEANDEQGFAEQFSSSIDNNLARNGNIRISDTENIQLLAKFMMNANKLKDSLKRNKVAVIWSIMINYTNAFFLPSLICLQFQPDRPGV